MTGHDFSHLNWRKSSRSGGVDDNSSCVEVASLNGHGIAARDSRDPNGPALLFTPTEWAAFTHRIKHGTITRSAEST